MSNYRLCVCVYCKFRLRLFGFKRMNGELLWNCDVCVYSLSLDTLSLQCLLSENSRPSLVHSHSAVCNKQN